MDVVRVFEANVKNIAHKLVFLRKLLPKSVDCTVHISAQSNASPKKIFCFSKQSFYHMSTLLVECFSIICIF